LATPPSRLNRSDQPRGTAQELSNPPTIGFGRPKGFSLNAPKAVVSGRGGEVPDLAKTNLPPR
jgi:pyruvate dehydrogenase (quinone)